MSDWEQIRRDPRQSQELRERREHEREILRRNKGINWIRCPNCGGMYPQGTAHTCP